VPDDFNVWRIEHSVCYTFLTVNEGAGRPGCPRH